MIKLNADNQTAEINGVVQGYDKVNVKDLITPVTNINPVLEKGSHNPKNSDCDSLRI